MIIRKKGPVRPLSVLVLVLGLCSCLGTGGTGSGSPVGVTGSSGGAAAAGGASADGPDDRLPGDAPEEGAIPATPERPASTAPLVPGDDCYAIVHRIGRYQDNPEPPETVVKCEESLRCTGYIEDRKQGIEVVADEGCEALYRARAERWGEQMEETARPNPFVLQPVETRPLPDPGRPMRCPPGFVLITDPATGLSRCGCPEGTEEIIDSVTRRPAGCRCPLGDFLSTDEETGMHFLCVIPIEDPPQGEVQQTGGVEEKKSEWKRAAEIFRDARREEEKRRQLTPEAGGRNGRPPVLRRREAAE